MTKDVVLGFVRHLLTFGGGLLVTKGTIDAGTLEQAVGAITALVGVAWSVFDKKKTA